MVCNLPALRCSQIYSQILAYRAFFKKIQDGIDVSIVEMSSFVLSALWFGP